MAIFLFKVTLLYIQCNFIINPIEEAYMYKAFKTRATKWLMEMYEDIQEKGAHHDWILKSNFKALQEY